MKSAALAPLWIRQICRRCASITVALLLCTALNAAAQPVSSLRSVMGDLQEELQRLDAAARASRNSPPPAAAELARIIDTLDRIRALDLLLGEEHRALDAKFLRE